MISLRGISGCICITAIIALFIIGHYASGYDNLFFAAPKSDSSVRVENAAELNLTYEVVSDSMGVNIFSVNHAYARLMRYPMINGSFLTQTAQTERRNNVVLNSHLAFEVFGSFDIVGNIYTINNEPHMIVGVIDDHQDERNAYISAVETAAHFLVVFETEEQAIADLKVLGVGVNQFHLVNISEIAEVVKSKPWLALMTAAVFILIATTRRTVMRIFRLAKKIQTVTRKKYWSEMIRSDKARTFGMLVILAVIQMIAAFWTLLKAAQISLHWLEYVGALNGVTSPAFADKVLLLKDLCLYSNIAFCVFIGGMILGGISIKEYKQGL